MANTDLKQNSELQIALELLGRPPRSPFRIVTRCPDKTPQVLEAEAVFKENGIWKPFPAFFWLLCPRLCKLVARLEQEGMVMAFSNRLSADEEFATKFKQGQLLMAKYRIEQAKKIYPGKLPEHILQILSLTSVAGSRNWRGVKCLHSHVAQQLAFGNNPIGEEVIKITGDCSDSPFCYNSVSKGSDL